MKSLWWVCLAAAVLCPESAVHAEAPPPDPEVRERQWTTHEEMLVFFDAATKISANSLAPHALGDLVQRSLSLLAADLDPHSHYLSAEAYAQYVQAQRPGYGGVGMELSEDRRGLLRCLPYPGTPAADAGIRDGDVLHAVDGTPVLGKRLPEVGWRIRGTSGSTVMLTVQTGVQAAREVEVTRARVRAPTVTAQPAGDLTWLRIYRFGATTPEELRNHLSEVPEGTPAVIDLRGNPGGGLYDAVDAARLFLPAGAIVTAIRDRDSLKVLAAESPPKIPNTQLILLQDERTASAAELFIAALTGNRRAVSAGSPTFGKGSTQRLIELMDGSALVLTDAVFLQPDRTPIPATGLPPTLHTDPAAATAVELWTLYRAQADHSADAEKAAGMLSIGE